MMESTRYYFRHSADKPWMACSRAAWRRCFDVAERLNPIATDGWQFACVYPATLTAGGQCFYVHEYSIRPCEEGR